MALLLPALLVGCLLPEDPVNAHTWDARIRPTEAGPQALEGRAAMVSQGSQTQVSVAVTRGGGVTGPLGWRLRSGRCSATGDPVAIPSAFPPFPLAGNGTGESGMALGRRLSPHEPWSVELHANPEGEGPPIACGNLIRSQ